MIIKEIEWICKNAMEAVVYVGADPFLCAGFSQPCNLSIGDKLHEPLYAMDTMGLITSNKELYVTKHQNSFSHTMCCKVYNIEKNEVIIGCILIELDCSLPLGVNVGDVVEFSCSRLDVIS